MDRLRTARGNVCAMKLIETREVLADAYGRRLHYRGKLKALLRHAVEVDNEGRELRVLCSRVKLENLADRHAGDPAASPTCPECLRKVR